MGARIEDARPPGPARIAGVIARVLAQGLLVLAGLATVALGFSWFVDAYREVGAYRSAPVCGAAAAAPGAPCLRHESGKVTNMRWESSSDSDTYELTVSRETEPAGTFNVGKAFYDEVRRGTDVDLKVWNGRVVEVSWHGHRATIHNTPFLTSFELALLVGAGTALTVYGLAWPRGSTRAIPAGVAFWTAVAAMLGSFLFTTAQWPFAVTLGIPLLGWLVVTVTTAIGTAGESAAG